MLHVALSFIIHSFHSSLNHYFLHKDVVCLFLSVKILGQPTDIEHPAVLCHCSLREKAVHAGKAPTDLRDTHCEGSAVPGKALVCYPKHYVFILHLKIFHLNSPVRAKTLSTASLKGKRKNIFCLQLQ